jgi:YVTN family beta-propeller protein
VLATIPVGRAPTLLAIDRTGSRVFAASSGTLSIITTGTNTVTSTVRTEPYPTGVAVTPDGQRVLLTSAASAGVLVVDLASGSTSSIGLIVDSHPGGFGRMALTRDGGRAFVTNQAKAYLAVVDLAARQTNEMSLDLRPSDVTLGPDGTLYVAGCKEFCTTGTVERIDPTSGGPRGSFAVGGGPYRFALAPDGSRAYATTLADASLSVVDVASGRTLATLPVGAEPTGLVVSPDGARVYVASQATDRLTIVDAATSTVAGTFAMANGPREIVLGPDGDRAYVSTRDAVVVLDTRRL